MDEIVKDFLIESNENLDRLDRELVKLETDPSSKEMLASIFRTIYAIKGSCGFLGFARLEKVAHASSIQVVVYSEGGRTVGLIVDRIVDIIEDQAAIEAVAARDGVVGSFVAQRHVTDLLDVPAMVRAGFPGFLRRLCALRGAGDDSGRAPAAEGG
jgi:Hpt domain